jgi:SAM-dependent methyltransferase
LFVLAWRAHVSELSGICLHMAPEPWLQPLVTERMEAVIRMDLEAPGVDLFADAEALPIQHGAIDLVVANDVLEHIEHDDRALAEIERVLSPEGLAFIHVPITAADTVEYGFANTLAHGHRRAYGPDVVDRFASAGLHLRTFSAAALPTAERKEAGLDPNDAVFIARPRLVGVS